MGEGGENGGGGDCRVVVLWFLFLGSGVPDAHQQGATNLGLKQKGGRGGGGAFPRGGIPGGGPHSSRARWPPLWPPGGGGAGGASRGGALKGRGGGGPSSVFFPFQSKGGGAKKGGRGSPRPFGFRSWGSLRRGPPSYGGGGDRGEGGGRPHGMDPRQRLPLLSAPATRIRLPSPVRPRSKRLRRAARWVIQPASAQPLGRGRPRRPRLSPKGFSRRFPPEEGAIAQTPPPKLSRRWHAMLPAGALEGLPRPFGAKATSRPALLLRPARGHGPTSSRRLPVASTREVGRREGSSCEAARARQPEAYFPYVEGLPRPRQRSRWALIAVRHQGRR